MSFGSHEGVIVMGTKRGESLIIAGLPISARLFKP